MKNKNTWIYRGAIGFAFLVASMPGAAAGEPGDVKPDVNAKDPGLQTRSLSALRQLEAPAGEEYTIGDGDEIDIQVASRPEISGHHVVGPDGRITLPLSGSFEIKNMTRETAAQAIAKRLERYYTTADVTVRVSKYGSNRILVVGHVAKPGVLYFENAPTLLEALSKSGASLTKGKESEPSLPQRCAIFRGQDFVVWIDLKSMLERGNAAAGDVRLRRDDVLYVPDEQDDLVSVLGEVQRPGMVKIDSGSTLLDVLALSGGLTASSGHAKIEVVRQSDRTTREIAFHDLLNPAKAREISLQKGDVVYVQKGSVAKFEYTLEKLAPIGTMMMFGSMLGSH
jgi:polysaccharide export outer membrane protein